MSTENWGIREPERMRITWCNRFDEIKCSAVFVFPCIKCTVRGGRRVELNWINPEVGSEEEEEKIKKKQKSDTIPCQAMS